MPTGTAGDNERMNPMMIRKAALAGALLLAAAAARPVPGKLAHHRQESRHALADVAAIGGGDGELGLIVNHAARGSL